ncbi:hypothetical protein T09_3764 [Trichinella sp. T9]|nr:hypothetical protein T09_3764 [Trichinella sp. T9]
MKEKKIVFGILYAITNRKEHFQNVKIKLVAPQDKSWCAAQICHLLLLDNRTTAIIYMQTVVTFFITSYLQQNSCMSNDATADMSLSDRWSL